MKAYYHYRKSRGEVHVDKDDRNNTITVRRGNRRTVFEYAATPTGFRLIRNGTIFDSTVDAMVGNEIELTINDRKLLFTFVDKRRTAGDANGSGQDSTGDVRAVMPGRVARVYVKPGQKVAKDDPLLVLEAMKMENEIKAGRAGTVKSVVVESGQSVEMGALLIHLD